MLLLKWKNGFKSLANFNEFWLLRYVNLRQTKCSLAANIWCCSLGTGKIYEGPVAKTVYMFHITIVSHISWQKGCLQKNRQNAGKKTLLEKDSNISASFLRFKIWEIYLILYIAGTSLDHLCAFVTIRRMVRTAESSSLSLDGDLDVRCQYEWHVLKQQHQLPASFQMGKKRQQGRWRNN